MKNQFKIIGSTLIAGAFLLIAFGSGEDNQKSSWTKNSKEIICGKEFKSEDYQKELDMQKKYITVLNCDGSYKSELDWNAYSKSSEEVYNNTIGTSQGNFESFSGSWEIITENIPDYLSRQITEYENFEPNHMPKNETTIIKYTSNKGRSGFAYIYKSNDKNEIILTPVPSALEASSSYEDDDLHMYFGRISE